MPQVKVWAPKANQVQIKIGDEYLTMEPCERGNWLIETLLAVHGADYGFILDGHGPLPDPRSPWQPNGPHGLSRFYDHNRFNWSDERWSAGPLEGAIIYELHIGTFTPEGTFDAAISKLDHLVGLGVTHLELMPVAEFPGSAGWGYDGVDLYAPHHVYGGPDGLKRFVDACHWHGLAVILDVVYNHLGPDGNYLGQFGWYYTDRYKTPWGEAVNFDGRNTHEVRRFFLDNAMMWMRDYHIDGLRLDAVHAMIDLTAFHVLETLAVETNILQAQLGRRLVLIAESNLNDPRIVRSREMGGYGIDAQWNDDFRHSLWTVLSGEQNGFHADFGALADLAKAITNVFVYDGRYSHYRQRRHGRDPFGISRWNFLAYLSNHDQIGNRAAGDRPAAVLSFNLLKVAAALILTSPFVPMLFMGEEWAASTPFQYFTDHQDGALAEAVRKGRIEEFAAFGWQPEEVPDPQAPDTSVRSKLQWGETGREPHASILEWHRELIALRRRHAALTAGDLEPISVNFDDDRRWLVIYRKTLEERALVACNLAGEAQHVSYGQPGNWTVLLKSDPAVRQDGDGLSLPPESVAILVDTSL